MICVGSGLVEVFGGYGVLWHLSPIQVHVGSALLAAPLLAWHVLRHRRQRLRRIDLSRRTLLRTGLLAAGVGTTYAALEGIGGLVGSASASRIATGSHKVAADADPGNDLALRHRSRSSGPTIASRRRIRILDSRSRIAIDDHRGSAGLHQRLVYRREAGQPPTLPIFSPREQLAGRGEYRSASV